MRDAAGVSSRGLCLGGKSIIMINLHFGHAEAVDNSKRNVEEARVVKDVYDQLKRRQDHLGLPPSEDDFASRLGIVSPFRAHNRSVLVQLQGIEEADVAMHDYTTTSSAEQLPDGGDGTPCVGTAHQFQGSERDVIMMSAYHLSSFSGDLRLLNVKLSRAKHLLVIVGRLEEFSHRSIPWRTIWGHSAACHVVDASSFAAAKQKLAQLLS